MGGKGRDTSAPTMPVQNNDGEMMQMMQAMMGSMMGSMESMNQMYMSNMQPPELPPFPSIPSMPDIDWADQNQKLNEKARADYKNERARKFGRLDTILTSPLLEDEEPELTKSLLTGA